MREALALEQYRALVTQAPLGYIALITMSIIAISAASPSVHPLTRIFLPCVLIAVAAYRLVVWLRRKPDAATPAQAAKAVANAGIISTIMAGCGSIWGAYSWASAPEHTSVLIPTIVTLSTLTPVLAQSMCVRNSIANLIAGITPIALTMAVAGDTADRLVATLIVVTSLYLGSALTQQSHRMVALLSLEHVMREEAKSDPLTGLVNHRALSDRFTALIEDARSGGMTHERPALIQIDLDGFKPVNKMHGHATGDEVLRQVADRLRRAVGKGATVCRVGGDEFAILTTTDPEHDAGVAGGRQLPDLCARVHAAFDAPFQASGHHVVVGISTGYAQWPQDGRTLDEMTGTADRRLIAAKDVQRRRASMRAFGGPALI
ncbi:GGDEF domain-containing protein [Novosphingobium ovatum]|uniref:GGDEF domain-containing protein n=1 Tax=Novosphingobium ovatum TaxID=1908523 RepID=UPI0029FF54FA|nr:diguanylate cyclase [Novosphingobium ovatum]